MKSPGGPRLRGCLPILLSTQCLFYFVCIANTLQSLKIATNSSIKWILSACRLFVCFFCSGTNNFFVPVAVSQLIQQKRSILFIWFLQDVKVDQAIFPYWYHIVESHDTQFPLIQFQYRTSRVYVWVVWLRRFQRHIIVIAANRQHDPNIRPAFSFVFLHSVVNLMQEIYVSFPDMIKAKLCHLHPLIPTNAG